MSVPHSVVVATDRALDGLYRLCAILAACAVVLIAVLVTTSIATRLLGTYIPGLTECAGYSMAAAGSLGLAYTFGNGGHIRVDLGLNMLGDTPRRRVDQFALALTAASVCFLAWYLVRMVWISHKYGDFSDGSDELPLWLPQIPVAFGFIVFAIALVHGAVRYLMSGQTPVVSDAPVLSSPPTGQE